MFLRHHVFCKVAILFQLPVVRCLSWLQDKAKTAQMQALKCREKLRISQKEVWWDFAADDRRMIC